MEILSSEGVDQPCAVSEIVLPSFVTNGWIEKKIIHQGQPVASILGELAEKESYSKCNRKSLQSKIADTIAKSKFLRKNKDSPKYNQWQEEPFHPPIKRTDKMAKALNMDKNSTISSTVVKKTKDMVMENLGLEEKLIQSESEIFESRPDEYSSMTTVKNNIAELKDDTELIDVISGDGETTKVKKKLLMQSSDYFCRMFSSGMRECTERTVKLDFITTEVLNMTVGFMTDNSIKLDVDNVEDLLEVATYLQIRALIPTIVEFLTHELTPQSLLEYEELASTFHLETLQSNIKRYSLQNFHKLVTANVYFKFSLGKLCELLESDDLQVNQELDLFRCALKYISHNALPEDDGKKLIGQIRFPLMPLEALQTCEALSKSISLDWTREFINEGYHYHSEASGGNVHAIQSIKTSVRCSVPCLITVGGFTGRRFRTLCGKLQAIEVQRLKPENSDISHEEEYTVQLRELSENLVPNDTKKLADCRLCVVDNYLYVVGGQNKYNYNAKSCTDGLYRYDPRHASWMRLCSMQTARILFYFGAINGKLYVVAGYNGLLGGELSSVECYNIEQNSWEYKKSMDVRLHEHAGCIWKDEIYISGGFAGGGGEDDYNYEDRVYRYAPCEDKWQDRAAMLHKRSYHVMCCIGDKMYVAGGTVYPGYDPFIDVNICESYDPVIDQWTELCRLPYAASCMSAIVVGTDFVLLGGHSFSEDHSHDRVQIINTVDSSVDSSGTLSGTGTNRIRWFSSAVLSMASSVLTQSDK